MKKGGYLIYASGHAHTGVVNATLYGQVKFTIIHLNKFCCVISMYFLKDNTFS